MRRDVRLAWIVAAALTAFGCDNTEETDAGTDASTMRADSGPGDDAGGGGTDAGGSDAGGSDAGPPIEMFTVRLAHNLPGIVDAAGAQEPLHVCQWLSFEGNPLGMPTFRTETVGPIAFRGVSPAFDLPVSEYFLAFYPASALGSPAACPMDPMASGAPPAAFMSVVPEPAVDSHVLLMLTGLLPDTFGATGGALPSICSAGVPPDFTTLCTAAAQLAVLADDATAPAAGMTRYRVSNQVANSFAPFTLCYDPGLVINPGDGTCRDTTPGGADATPLAVGVAYGAVSESLERAPLVPTGAPAAGVGGGLYLLPEAGAGACLDFTEAVTAMATSDRCYPILDVSPRPGVGNIRGNLAADSINTIFISGALRLGARDTTADGDFAASFFIWEDTFTTP